MSLLAWLTLGYAAVLVVALAVSLTAIAVQLTRTGKLLGEACEALERVRDHTGPLEAPLAELRDVTDEVAQKLGPTGERLRSWLDRRGEARERVAAGPGAPEPGAPRWS